MSYEILNIQEQDFETKIKDEEKQFIICYSKKFDMYVMQIPVWWIAMYERMYKVTKEDISLYKKDKRGFYKKYENELSQKLPICFNENFIGANNIRDYDGANNFQHSKPSNGKNANPFIGHVLIDGIFYAAIEWADETVYVPPLQIVNGEYPLHDKCKLYEIDGKPICYVRK